MTTMESIYLKVAGKIRRARARSKVSVGELAAKSGMSRSNLNMIELGQQRISIHHLFEVAKALKVPVRDLLPADSRPAS